MNMDDAFEKRKTELVRLINELYKEKPAGWFKEKGDVYTSTWDVGNEVDDIPPEKEEIIVRRSKKAYIIISTALLVFILTLLYEYFNSPDAFGILIIAPFACLFVYTFVLSYDRKPKIVINKKGIWLKETDCYFEWHIIGATYIKDEDKGEDTVRSLVIYYYEPAEHDFIKAEYKFPSLLDLSIPKIAYYIEYWKIKTGYRTPKA